MYSFDPDASGTISLRELNRLLRKGVDVRLRTPRLTPLAYPDPYTRSSAYTGTLRTSPL